jgi:threonyl-tRNA synthetase
MEEAKRRDHRVLGKKLDLYSLQEDAGGGLVFWHPKGNQSVTLQSFCVMLLLYV